MEKVAKSFSEIAVACMMIGIARGILVVLQAGHIIDTIIILPFYPAFKSSGSHLGDCNVPGSDRNQLLHPVRFRPGGDEHADYGALADLIGISDSRPYWHSSSATAFQHRMAYGHDNQLSAVLQE